MMSRVFAWVAVLLVCAGVWRYASSYTSPWSSVVGSPVLSQLPVAANGCGKDCTQ